MAEQPSVIRAHAAESVSGHFMEAVRHAYIRCLQDRDSGRAYAEGDNNASPHAIEAYILSVAALESFIHETISMANATHAQTVVEVEDVERWDIRQKYLFIPQLLWQRTYERGREPFQSFHTLVVVRNDLVHYKMEEYELGTGPGYRRVLESKHILLPGEDWNWIQQLSTRKGALWAHNIACEMVQKFAELADNQTRQGLQSSLQNFQAIGENDSIDSIQGRKTVFNFRATLRQKSGLIYRPT